MFSVKFLTDIGQALLSHEEGALTKILKNKLESEASDLLMQFVPATGRLGRAIATGGQSELDRARNQFLGNLRPRPLPYSGYVRKLGRAIGASGRSQSFDRRGRGRRRPRPGTWQASDWAASRQDWLDNRWRHDWRSQPRDELGRWIPGRLEYIAPELMYRGKRRGRVVRRRRRKRSLHKRQLRKAIRNLVRS